MKLNYKGKEHQAYLSHIKVQIAASKMTIDLVLVYGIMEHPMMLAPRQGNPFQRRCHAYCKDLFSRWHIVEYFRCKKDLPV